MGNLLPFFNYGFLFLKDFLILPIISLFQIRQEEKTIQYDQEFCKQIVVKISSGFSVKFF